MMRSSVSILLCCALLAVCTAGHAGGEFPGIEQLMTPGQFAAAGLKKLSPEELKVLNRWLEHHTGAGVVSRKTRQPRSPDADAAAATAPRAGDKEVFAPLPKEKKPEKLVTHIVGEFTGWSGKTTFRLGNGQVWQQRQSGRLAYRATDPKVEIYKDLFGYYVLKLIGTHYVVGVTRIR